MFTLLSQYTINLTIAGTSVNAFLDTGSTDLWVAPRRGAIGPFESTGVAVKLAFGDGNAFVNGTIGLGKVEIAGSEVPAQAFLNVTQNVGFTGEFGLVGLSFDDPSIAQIPAALTAAKMDGAVVGKSLLSSIFDQNPDKGRFFGLSLSRQHDKDDSADASLDIGELDVKYAAVQNTPILSLFPENGFEWSVLTDGIHVNGVSIPWFSNSKTTPPGKNLVLLDSGTTNILVPAEIRDAIYSVVPGAILAKNSSIPTIQMSASFAGERYRIHPLDVTDFTVALGPDGKNYTICVGAITNGGVITADSLDALFGDTFLRNVYTVFSFGNDTTPPHVQLLSQTDKNAPTDFAKVRAKRLHAGPPELAPADIIALFDGPSSSVSTSGKVSNDLANPASSPSEDSQVTKYAPIVIGLLGANLLVLLVLAFLGITGLVKGGRQAGPTRQYTPVKLREDVHGAEEGRYSDGPH
ncbi:aspartic peptidase domain-containing protein [Mycena capillaripes]|nr:aspartic peptidase domain-containing protein [Mycena capillaripes]